VQDGLVDYYDLKVFADTWLKQSAQTGYNKLCDFYHDGKINFKDFAIFSAHWYPSNGDGLGQSESTMSMSSEDDSSLMQSESPQQSPNDSAGSSLAESQQSQSEESQQQSEQQYTPDYNLPAIYLTCDNNKPEPNDEVTIQVHSAAPLFAMELGIYISGDANITTAMSEADCNNFGWDNGWNSDPYIDPNGYVYLNGLKWNADVNGVIGYVKFRYHSGQVSVYIDTEYSLAVKWDDDEYGSYVPFSQETILIARDPNEP
jgi:hypothetical protein